MMVCDGCKERTGFPIIYMEPMGREGDNKVIWCGDAKCITPILEDLRLSLEELAEVIRKEREKKGLKP